MKSSIFLSIAGICALVTGITHTLTHLSIMLFDNQNTELKQTMINTKIKIITEKSLFDYHNGFSLATGILVIGLGIVILQSKKARIGNIHVTNMIITGAMSIISIIYFHPIVIFLLGISFMLQLIFIIKPKI